MGNLTVKSFQKKKCGISLNGGVYRKSDSQIQLLGGAFELDFGLGGQEFERTNLQKFNFQGKRRF